MTKHQPSLDRVFHALGDSTRLTVLQRLSQGPASVSELAKPFDIALPTFMQHLKVLEECGLVRSRKEGRVRTCEVVPNRLAEAERWIADQRAVWEGRLDRMEAFARTLHQQSKK